MSISSLLFASASTCESGARMHQLESSTIFLLGIIWRLSGNTFELLGGFIKSPARCLALRLGDRLFTRSPELFDGFDAPQRAGPRGADGFAVHEDIDGIGVELRK